MFTRGDEAMLLYWDGYEIDGSDTAFDITLPENVQAWEFAECFLNIPIFTDSPKPQYTRCWTNCYGVWHGNECKKITREKLKSNLLSGNYKRRHSIEINCQHPDLLSDELRAKLYATSKHSSSSKAENLCMAPVVQQYFDRGGFTMQLCMYKSTNGKFTISLHVGPGAYYEYTMFVLNYMREHFPSVEIDFEHGFNTCTCNFGDNYLYELEKIRLPIKYNVNYMLKWLTEHGLESYCSYNEKDYKRGYDFAADGFFIAENFFGWSNKKDKLLFSKYLELVEMSTAENIGVGEQTIVTAVNILLPLPELFSENTEVVQVLEKLFKTVEQTEWNKDWINMYARAGYMSFYTIDGVTTCELRVRTEMKEYLQTWLNLSDSGMIDFIKPEMYKRRNEQD